MQVCRGYIRTASILVTPVPGSINSDLELSKRRNRILRLFSLIEKNPGEPKYKLMGAYMLASGVGKSVFYEYLEVLVFAGRVVEEKDPELHIECLWTQDAFKEELRQRNTVWAKNEAELAKVNSLDAYNLES